MVMGWLMLKMIDPAMDEMMKKILTEDYPSNPFTAATIAEKLSLLAIVEAGIRAATGSALERPIGGPIVLSEWEKILLSPKQLFELPTPSTFDVATYTVIGKRAKRPLKLSMPIMITGMSYGGSLSLPMKIALAKGASVAGTSTNTGESAVSDEERDSAKYLIGQYNRGGWLNTDEQLKRVDAIEVQFGQGAFGGGVQSTQSAEEIGKHLREVWHLKKGEDAIISARFPGVNSSQEIINLVNELKANYDVPVGIKIAGSDYIEYELEVISKTDADYIAIDGSEGGTAVAPPTLEDNVGLPTLHSLARAVQWLEENKARDNFDVIIAGGLKTPGHYLKALALGADAVYIGSIALIATMQTHVTKALPQSPPSQIALYKGKLKDELDVDKAAQNLANFLKSSIAEMKLAVQAIGKRSLSELNRDDLVTVDKDLAEFLQIRYAASKRKPREEREARAA